MRAAIVVLLCLPGPCSVLAQQRPCTVAVSVRVPDLPQLSRAAAQRMAVVWERNIRAGKYELPDGRWNTGQEHRDFLGAKDREGHAFETGRDALRGWQAVCGLSAGAFTAHDEEGQVAVLSVEPDRRPRRVVFVVENGKRMTLKARKIESAAIADIVSKAPPQDSFALLTAGGSPVALPLGSSRGEIRDVAEKLAEQPPVKSKGGSVLAAVLQASRWLEPHQPGDSIFVMAMRLEPSRGSGFHLPFFKRRRQVSFKDVRAAASLAHIRVFGVQLGAPPWQPSDTTCHSSTDNCMVWFGKVEGNGLQLLSEANSGAVAYENTKANKKQHLITDWGELVVYPPTASAVTAEAKHIFGLIDSDYLLHLDSSGSGLVVNLSPSAQLKTPWFVVAPADGGAGFACSGRPHR